MKPAKRWNIRILFILTPLLSLWACATPTLLPREVAASCDLDFLKTAEAIVKGYGRSRAFSGSVLVSRPAPECGQEGFQVYRGAYGYARGNKATNTAETRFRIGSITKQFTAVAVLRLVGEGKIGLDDPATKYLHGLPSRGNPGKITVRHLLNHRSGLPDFTDSEATRFGGKFTSVDELTARLFATLRKRGSRAPGRRFEYNNTNYLLLGRIVELKSGLAYGDYVTANFLNPLGMSESGVGISKDVPNAAQGYVSCPDGDLDPVTDDDHLAQGSGAIFSTVGDLYRWTQALFVKGKLIEAAARDQMVVPPRGSDYAFGTYVRKRKVGDERVNVLEHPGTMAGYSSQLSFYPDQGVTIILLSNQEDSHIKELEEELTRLAMGGRAPRHAHRLP